MAEAGSLISGRVSRRAMSWMVLAVLLCLPIETMTYTHWLAYATLPPRAAVLVAMLVALRLERLDPIVAGRLFLAQATLTILGWSFFVESSPDKIAFEAVGYGTILPVITLLIAPRATRRVWSFAAMAVAVAPSIIKLLPDHLDLIGQIGAVLVVHATGVVVLDIHANRAEQAGVIGSLDPLTGLLNRRPMLAEIDARLGLDDGERSTVVLVDIDHFKAVNDTSGHEAGDDVLIRVAEVLTGQLRTDSSVCRWGGEEFLVLLPDATEERAAAIAERLREAVADSGVTASFGVAEAVVGDSSASWIRRADEAMYVAKERGRDQVVTASAIQAGSSEPVRVGAGPT